MRSSHYVAVVAHDAGAANHIFAWIRSGLIDIEYVKLCLSGPALSIYQKIQPDFKNNILDVALDESELLISGTGWASTLEHDSRVLASAKGLKVIAVLDHWSNYKERFVVNDQVLMPDAIWVVDEYASTMASDLFPNVDVVQQPNNFIAEQVEEINSFPEFKKSLDDICILFVMEPIRCQWDDNNEAGELQALRFLVDNIKLVSGEANVKLIIRPHPSDPNGKYVAVASSYCDIDICIDEKSSLSKLIAWSDVVIGCQTYAMVVALSANKKVISALPYNAPQCLLPQKEIIHLRELV